MTLWPDDRDDTFYHRNTCDTCIRGGYPYSSAYRPHTLDAACWCVVAYGDGRACHVAVEFGMAPPQPKPASLPMGGYLPSDVADRITAREYYDAYRESVLDLQARDSALYGQIQARRDQLIAEWNAANPRLPDLTWGTADGR